MLDRDKVRLLITDTNPEKLIFTNVEIDQFLVMEDNDVKLAAATALDTIATNEALVLKVIDLLDLSTDGARLAETLMKRADKLREQGNEEFDIYGVYEEEDEIEEDE
jgi:hypothetical protein